MIVTKMYDFKTPKEETFKTEGEEHIQKGL